MPWCFCPWAFGPASLLKRMVERNVSLRPRHIRGKANVAADPFSGRRQGRCQFWRWFHGRTLWFFFECQLHSKIPGSMACPLFSWTCTGHLSMLNKGNTYIIATHALHSRVKYKQINTKAIGFALKQRKYKSSVQWEIEFQLLPDST